MNSEKHTSQVCKSCSFKTSVLLPGQITKQISCGRYPPTVVASGASLLSIFPPVQPDMVCGEYLLSPDKHIDPSLKLVQ